MSVGELFFLAIISRFNSDKLKYIILMSENGESESIGIVFYKVDTEVCKNSLGSVSVKSINYDSFKKEYTEILKYMLVGEFNNVPKKVFQINEKMPYNQIKCSGVYVGEYYRYDDF
ncbi:MAG: hypothetical protein ACRC68_12755 [Clostridium sp.]